MTDVEDIAHAVRRKSQATQKDPFGIEGEGIGQAIWRRIKYEVTKGPAGH